MTEFYVQYAGGNSTPNSSPDRTQGWGEFFEAQTLVTDPIGNRFAMKTSEISARGGMVISAKSGSESRTMYDLTSDEIEAHYSLVVLTLRQMRKMCSNAPLILGHTNQSDENNFITPKDLTSSRLDVTVKNCQSIGSPHTHCDVLDIDKFFKIYSVNKLRKIHRDRLALEQGSNLDVANEINQKIETLLFERRRQMKPRVFYRFSQEIWKKEVRLKLLSKFPDMFQIDDVNEYPQLPPQTLSISFKESLDQLDIAKFAEVVQFINYSVESNWVQISELLLNMRSKMNEDVDGLSSEQLLDQYELSHPWAVRYRKTFMKLADLIQDRRIVPLELQQDAEKRIILKPTIRKQMLALWNMERSSWLHKKFNFTLGIADWAGKKPLFFVSIYPDVSGGSEGVGIISIREQRELTPKEKIERIKFRARLIKNLGEQRNDLLLGSEGEYTLVEYDGLMLGLVNQELVTPSTKR